ncbi:unnamed protein product [Dovyalis caffra]|uniref:Uncharacterized protein n=1 Tax=Dovyalis caffra TaxID=77055 RepID=A0AAV1QUI0_9ROSI|nr:unnamed protein product [Dovyalis caffra]
MTHPKPHPSRGHLAKGKAPAEKYRFSDTRHFATYQFCFLSMALISRATEQKKNQEKETKETMVAYEGVDLKRSKFSCHRRCAR